MTREIKLFTLDEARSALPLIRRIAEDVRSVVKAMTRIPGGVGVLIGTNDSDDVPAGFMEEFNRLLTKFEGCVGELEEIGVELKGIDPVLVDFHSIRNGKNVYLCWALGEKDLTHWHTLSGGYTARQEL